MSPQRPPLRGVWTDLGLFGVMQAAGPVDGDLCRLLVQLHGAGHRAASGELTELVQTVKHGTVLAHVN